MVVLVNVIKPQGLEPLQFPTKFRSPSVAALAADSERFLALSFADLAFAALEAAEMA